MSSEALNRRDRPQSVAAIVDKVRERGVQLWSERGCLRYRGPKGALTGEELDELKTFKHEIAVLLEQSSSVAKSSAPFEESARANLAPLSYSQLAHWRMYRLWENSAVRQLASATRIFGHVDTALVGQTFSAMTHRHEALRTHIAVVDGEPMQFIADSLLWKPDVIDLTGLAQEAAEAEVERRIEEFILKPIDVTCQPLIGVLVLKLREDEHVLVVAMEHLISDAYSLHILVRDFFAAYRQAHVGEPVQLPEIPLQFSEYSKRLRLAEGVWVRREGNYWREHLADCESLRFPEDRGDGEFCLGRGIANVEIGEELKLQLEKWCRSNRTTLVMAMFTAYAALALRWCGTGDSVIRYQTDGRFHPSVENSIGYFATVINLRVRLTAADTFIDLLERVTQEYCAAIEHADHGYLDAQWPPSKFTRISGFNWVPHAMPTEPVATGGIENVLTLKPVKFAPAARKNYPVDSDPLLLLYDAGTRIVGAVHFPLMRFSAAMMEAFAGDYMSVIGCLRQRPDQRIADLVLCGANFYSR